MDFIFGSSGEFPFAVMKEKPSVPPRPSHQTGAGSKISADQTLHLAWTALHGEYPKRESFTSDKDFSAFCQYYNVLRTVCRRPPHKRKEEEIKEILIESKIPGDISKEMLGLLRGNEVVEIDRFLLNEKPRLVSVVDIQWRISVTISTSFVSRALTPYVQLLLTLSDGRVFDIEMNLQKFHQLRHTVASVLKEMQLLEAMSVMQK